MPLPLPRCPKTGGRAFPRTVLDWTVPLLSGLEMERLRGMAAKLAAMVVMWGACPRLWVASAEVRVAVQTLEVAV